jgi:hypothetical protein
LARANGAVAFPERAVSVHLRTSRVARRRPRGRRQTTCFHVIRTVQLQRPVTHELCPLCAVCGGALYPRHRHASIRHVRAPARLRHRNTTKGLIASLLLPEDRCSQAVTRTIAVLVSVRKKKRIL